MTINQKKSLVAFYISKFNDDAFRELGYGGPVSKAMDDLSVRITGPGVAPNAYLRRRRDEFDVFFDNGRVGQRNRKPTETVKELYGQWNVMEFEEITEIVKSVLDGTMEETQVINLDVDGEKVSEYDVEQYLNFDDNTAALNKTVKSVIERTYSKKKVEKEEKNINKKEVSLKETKKTIIKNKAAITDIIIRFCLLLFLTSSVICLYSLLERPALRRYAPAFFKIVLITNIFPTPELYSYPLIIYTKFRHNTTFFYSITCPSLPVR